MGGGKKSKRDGDKKSRKRNKDTPVASREASDDESYPDELSNGPDSMVPSAAKIDMEVKSDAIEDDFGAKDFRSQMDLRPDHEV